MEGKTAEKKKLDVGLYGFTGCNGDQLVIVHSEDQLLDFFGSANIKSFSLAKSDNDDTAFDVAFIEGSISNREQAEHVKHIRERSKMLVAIGNCACTGGIQAMEVRPSWEERHKKVYGQNKLAVRTPTPSRPVGEVVKVDFYVPGCPIDAEQFYFIYGQILSGNQPVLPDYPVCADCRWKENECLLLKGVLCVGPLTAAGCGAVCPSHNLPCLGCWGLVKEGNVDSQFNLLKEKGYTAEAIQKRFTMHTGTGIAEPLKKLLGA